VLVGDRAVLGETAVDAVGVAALDEIPERVGGDEDDPEAVELQRPQGGDASGIRDRVAEPARLEGPVDIECAERARGLARRSDSSRIAEVSPRSAS
jgi:hypothetical protein